MSLEKINSLLEIVDYFLRWYVVGVADGPQCTGGNSVFAPLVPPETLIVAVIVLPMSVHKIQ